MGYFSEFIARIRNHFVARHRHTVTEKTVEALFDDLYHNRQAVYRLNFFRGIFFGFGSVLGGSVVIALVIGMLSLLTDIPGGIGAFVQEIIQRMDSAGR